MVRGHMGQRAGPEIAGSGFGGRNFVLPGDLHEGLGRELGLKRLEFSGRGVNGLKLKKLRTNLRVRSARRFAPPAPRGVIQLGQAQENECRC